MKKILYSVFACLFATLGAAMDDAFAQTCKECMEDGISAWCIFGDTADKTRICVDKDTPEFCTETLKGIVHPDCTKLSGEDLKGFAPTPPDDALPKSCKKCTNEKGRWCVSDLILTTAKYCLGEKASDKLCLNGKVHKDCEVVGDDDTHAYFNEDKDDCFKCVEDKAMSWCVIATGKLESRGCYSDKLTWLSCALGKTHKACKDLKEGDRKAKKMFRNSGSAAGLSAFVAVGAILAAML